MKKFNLIFVFILLLTSCKEPEVSMEALDVSEVDKRVELLSIVFRLAGNEEYNNKLYKNYTDRIEAHFGPYRSHKLIQFAKKMLHRNGVSYDAVMSMAIHLDEELNPLVNFSASVPEKRWGKRNAEKFVRLLKQFYIDANCAVFFQENAEIYAQASQNIQPLLKSLDNAWFHSFYGVEPNEEFKVIAALGNGHSNYGPRIVYPDGKREVYAILGAWNIDKDGNPTFPLVRYKSTLIHEFCHSFVNQLLYANPEPFRESGERIFELVGFQMRSQAYPHWKTMFNEALVRASVIKYHKDHGYKDAAVQKEIQRQKGKGFLWIKELVYELENYDNNREKYPTLESYMEQIAKAYEGYTQKIDTWKEEMEQDQPKVVGIREFENNSEDVNPKLQTITIDFDRPLAGEGYSFNYGPLGKEGVPKIKGVEYTDNNKSVIIQVQLEANSNYQLLLTGKAFKSSSGVSTDDFMIEFRTKDKSI